MMTKANKAGAANQKFGQVADLPVQLHRHLEQIERGIEDLKDGIETVLVIGEAGKADGMNQQAGGLCWTAERLGSDAHDLGERMEKLRSLIEQVEPGVKTEADRISAAMRAAVSGPFQGPAAA